MSIMLDSIIVAEQMYVGPRESPQTPPVHPCLLYTTVGSLLTLSPVLFEIRARMGFIGRYRLQKVIWETLKR